ncbi:MAG: toll/interleukin-1 receptor domain-containing protein [Pseudomonadota bacterium]
MTEKKGVFISYRRGSATRVASAIRREITNRFPSADVFNDGVVIDAGADWPDRIRAALEDSVVLLALINEEWLTARKGMRHRLDIENDWVRAELTHAFVNGVPVTPVLIDDAELPRNHDDLPTCLHPLFERQTTPLREDPQDEINDLRKIADAVGDLLPDTAREARPEPHATPHAPDGYMRISDAVAMAAELANGPNDLRELARTKLDAGEYHLAELLYRAAYEGFVEAFGEDHPTALTARHNIALAQLNQGEVAEAADALAKLVPMREKVQGPEHPDSLITFSVYASALNQQGKSKEAADAFARLNPLLEKVHGAENPYTLTARHNYANALLDQSRAVEASELLAELILLREKVQGADHPDTLTARHEHARTLIYQGKAAKAVEAFEALIPLLDRVQGAEHPRNLTSKCALSHAALENGDPQLAKQTLESLLLYSINTNPLLMGKTALLRGWLADCDGNDDKATDLLSQAEAHLAHLEPEHYARRELARYRETRVPGGPGGTTIWLPDAKG